MKQVGNIPVEYACLATGSTVSLLGQRLGIFFMHALLVYSKVDITAFACPYSILRYMVRLVIRNGLEQTQDRDTDMQ